MKRKIVYRSGFVFLLVFFLGTSCYSQNLLQGNDASRDLAARARAEAEQWTLELAMSAKQTALMEDRLVEYAIKKDQILHSKMREEVKARMLTNLELAENKAMRDILTKQQYDRYLFLKRQQARQKNPRETTGDTLVHRFEAK